jgi:hypothetical protein
MKGKPAMEPLASNIEETTKICLEKWGSKTIEDFRQEALQDENGTACDALRIFNGERMMLALCLTGTDKISLLEKILDLRPDSVPSDWNSLTVADIFIRTAKGVGLSYEELRDSSNEREAIILCATTRDSVRLLESIFELPD